MLTNVAVVVCAYAIGPGVGVEVTNQDGVVVLDGSAEVRVEPLREA